VSCQCKPTRRSLIAYRPARGAMNCVSVIFHGLAKQSPRRHPVSPSRATCVSPANMAFSAHRVPCALVATRATASVLRLQPKPSTLGKSVVRHAELLWSASLLRCICITALTTSEERVTTSFVDDALRELEIIACLCRRGRVSPARSTSLFYVVMVGNNTIKLS